MRIVVVSAHFPPNFVSGGTLQPQRLAQGLLQRGHDVHVYAGWLGDLKERPPGTAWDDRDALGLPVRWIAVTPWTSWDDRRNFDNPVVARDFAAFMSEVRPNVVHFHSIQTLGASLVSTAAASTASVVITMHDFWWCCARQFLVNTSVRPCCPVVDAGNCHCSVNRQWLERRNAWLRDQLASADLVLAPSAPAAALLAANGVAPNRLEVDENGMPDIVVRAAPPRATRPVGQPVRFLYAGGSDEMKGVHVLFGACRLMQNTPGWSLRAFGAATWLTDHVADPRGDLHELPIEVLEAFAPETLDDVLLDADVLVLPSVMRESHSLLTREALARGVPVITSDCLGPEQVVIDGHNGLVVPSADEVALAEAMKRITADRALLGTLQGGTRGVSMRTIDDQLDGLERRYRELRASVGSADALPVDRRPIRHVLFVVGIEGAPLRYRARLPAEALGLLGVRSEVRWFTDPDLASLADGADAVVVYRVPATKWVLEVIARTRDRGVPVLFDADDLIFDPQLADEIPALRILSPADAAHWIEGIHRYRTTMEACDAYVASTPALARHAAQIVQFPVERFDNGVGLLLGRASDLALARPRTPGPLRIGYFSGTDTHDHDWSLVEPAVAEVMTRFGDVELWLVGHLPATPSLARFGGRVRRLPFTEWRNLPELLRDLDVNLSPLAPASRFNEAKSAIKWLEAALVGTPTIASPTEPLRDAIDDDVNGLLASDREGWVVAVERLLSDRLLRERLGQRARRDALMRWSPHMQGPRYLALLERVAHGLPLRDAGVIEPRERSTSWVPVVIDEAIRPHVVEPYTDRKSWLIQAETRLQLVRRRARLLFARSRQSIADDGVLASVAKVPRAVRRAGGRWRRRFRN